MSDEPNPMSHLAALELVSDALDRERKECDHWRKEANALRLKLAEHDRWESGFRSIVYHLGLARTSFEIRDVVERVRSLAVGASEPDLILLLDVWNDGYSKGNDGCYSSTEANDDQPWGTAEVAALMERRKVAR